jgi:hypothetical protein
MRLLVVYLLSIAFLACGDGDARSFPPIEATVRPSGEGSTNPIRLDASPRPPRGVAILQDVRIGSHPENGGWDRIVFEFLDALPVAAIEYLDSATQCGSGASVQVAGSSVLNVRFDPAQAHNDAGQATLRLLRLDGPKKAIFEARLICDFEAEVSWAIGTQGRRPFKVTTLTQPSRIVIDVKW